MFQGARRTCHRSSKYLASSSSDCGHFTSIGNDRGDTANDARRGRLLNRYYAVTVRAMRPLARLLQFVGLTIPPLAVVAQLMENITTGQMLRFLMVSVCLFTAGYLLQQYGGGKS